MAPHDGLAQCGLPLAPAARERHEAHRRAAEMLERVGLGHLGERYPNELSGGEQQRVALARALVGGVGLLLFDEPLSNLDADMREQLRLAISTLARDSGATSVYITHDQSEAFSLADRVGVLRDGRIVQVGPPEELYLRPASPFVARFTGICSEMPVTLAAAPHGRPWGPVVRRPAGRAPRAPWSPPPCPGRSATGDKLQMFVRPSAVHIVAPAGAQVRGPGPGRGLCRAGLRARPVRRRAAPFHPGVLRAALGAGQRRGRKAEPGRLPGPGRRG